MDNFEGSRFEGSLSRQAAYIVDDLEKHELHLIYIHNFVLFFLIRNTYYSSDASVDQSFTN